METLPTEILEIIVRQLTPKDFACCSAVCHKWHKIFNQEWIWELQCKPELEEPLRTIPCMATPGFEAPEGSLPVSDWKLAFIRETHFWKNWRREELSFLHSYLGPYWKEQILNRNENIVHFKTKHILVHFLTDSEVVVWCSDHIEIVNVSVKPAVVVAKTDTPILITRGTLCHVIGNNMLVMEKVFSFFHAEDAVISVEVFTINTVEKSIKFKHSITLNHEVSPNGKSLRLVKKHLYFHVTCLRPKLLLYDLNTGTLLKEESCPKSNNPPLDRNYINVLVKCVDMATSPSSDFVAFGFEITTDSETLLKYYIYSVKDLKFLPNVVDGIGGTISCTALNHSWLAIRCGFTLKVVNLLSIEECTFPFKCFAIQECDDSFIISCNENKTNMLKRYNPSLKTLTNICKMSNTTFEIINNTYTAVFESNARNSCSESVWKLSGRDVEKWNIFAFSGCEINQSLTKMLIKDQNSALHSQSQLEFSILYLW